MRYIIPSAHSSVIIVSLLILLALAGCLQRPMEPLTLIEPPWSDGEISRYDVLDAQGRVASQAQWAWHRHEDGWELTYELPADGRPATSRQVVVIGPDLWPQRSEWYHGTTRVTIEYGSDTVFFTQTADGDVQTKEIPLPPNPLDNSQTLQTQRALPLEEGYVSRYVNVIPPTQRTLALNLYVEGRETVTVPAGTFETWHLTMRAGQSRNDAWYTVDPPHLMVKYHNRNAGTQFLLRSWQPHSGADRLGNPEPAPIVSAEERAPRPPNWPFVATSFLLQYPLMLFTPVVIGLWIRRRFGIGWNVFLIGAVTFVASQVVHLPLNWALGLLNGSRGVALWPLPAVALVAGLSAGVCEEGARWLVLRYWLRKARSWAAALQFGAGHGGIESIIFGVLAGLSLVSMLALAFLPPALLGVTPAQAASVQASADIYWGTGWYMPILAGLERLFVIPAHIAMAVLVMRSVQRRRIGYLLGAIGWHTAINTWAVWGSAMVEPQWVEAGLGVFGLASLGLIYLLRERA